MIELKNESQFAKMKVAGRITGEALKVGEAACRPGVTTKQIDELIHDYIVKQGAIPSFLGYGGFPGSACISLNDQVIHGIPSKDIVLKDGDLVKLDVGATYDGYNGDAARTVPVGCVSAEALTLARHTEESFWLAFKLIRDRIESGETLRLGDIGHTIESYVNSCGFSVVRKYVGHGIGRNMHESPDVPNYGKPGRGQRVTVGMALAVEPMVNIGSGEVKELSDGWTVITADGSLSSHYENTILVTDKGVIASTYIE
ncbi:MAG: type I methionyl aminopeptidase [Eubacteriales bacterium]|jgi:methionyl aminopeptidase